MKKSLIFCIIIVIIILGALGYRLKLQNIIPKQDTFMAEKVLANKKIALVIAFRDFRDVEYFIPREILEEAGAQIITVSTQKGVAVGADGGEVEVNLAAPEVNVENFDAVAFIGGPGMGQNLENEDFQKIAKEAVKAEKVIGAICIAPALLAKAGVLTGKKATVWSSPLDKSAIKMLKEGEAEYVPEDVVVDGKIITASGPQAAKQFAEKLIKALMP